MDLKSDLSTLKNRLESIEGQLEAQMKELDSREKKWGKLEKDVQEILKIQNDVVRFNVGGVHYATSADTLLKTPDTLLYKIVASKRFDLNDEIFFDRSPNFFSVLLDFLRTKQISYKKYTKEELKQLQVEAEYYEIGEINDYLGDLAKPVEFVKLEFNAPYVYKGQTAGTNLVTDLTDKSQMKGVCTASPGWIIVEMKRECEFEEMEVGGWKGNSTIWYCENGSGSTIYTSTDKEKWTQVGNIPSGYGSKIVKVKVKKSTANWIKFQYTGYLGLGYLDVKKIGALV
jgi:hypothetical protein